MNLEASLIRETSTRMAQVQTQLIALRIQLQEIANGKEKHMEIWCTTYRIIVRNVVNQATLHRITRIQAWHAPIAENWIM